MRWVVLLLTMVRLAVAAVPTTTTAPATTTSAEPVLQTCLATAADMTAVYPTAVFPLGTKELSATVALDKSKGIGKLTSTWIALDVGDAAPANYQIATADMDVAGSSRCKFKYSQPKPMPPGKYRVDITADGAPMVSSEFTVSEEAGSSNVKKPEDLLPLQTGLRWTFDFVRETAAGDRRRGLVAMTVANEDEGGAHIELRRDRKLMAEEWWLLDKPGLTARRRKVGDGPLAILDPPQTLWAWPLQTPRTWAYRPKDRSYTQIYRMWGPVPVDSPAGPVSGFVVLCEQKNGTTALSVERHWIPGVGLAREIIINAVNDAMVSRQEMKLTNNAAKQNRELRD